ncbi:putative protein SQS1 [Glarea lozoyensis 74030]|nr:putative protein SQS1 [Glarea lozoyensis 74030]
MAQEEEEEEDVEEGPVKRKTYVDQFRPRELGWGEADGVQDVFDRSSVEPAKGTYGESGWNTDDMQDFEGVSTSDGEEGEVRQILSKRDRKRGVSYLVIYCGQTFDDAKWVTDSKLKGKKELRLIAEFEAEERLLEGFIREAERMQNSDDSSDEDLDDDSDSDGDDEELLLQKKMERMSDEQIARLLAKQEELGMGSNELLLFDAEADEEDDDEEDIDFGFSAFTSSAGKGPIMKGSKKPGAKRPRGGFPPATALANAYDGFDVMDFERPSLKKKPKGRKGKLPVDISDSELEDSMNTAWENDRLKKKERKQEREELRAQGLLGSKNGKVDLKAKYKEGMGIEAVKEAIRIFLMNGRDTTLPLTPMDKGDRKLVHEFAQAFNLKSKSVGAGNKRFPVLYRTKNTIMYSESKFATIDAKLSRRFMKRPDAGGKKFGGTPRPARGGGFGNSAASYRDGDVVGASAPELGVENRGRAMLEKMGWSTGTALGALNNKGILQPVAHVVKTTKAGLG